MLRYVDSRGVLNNAEHRFVGIDLHKHTMTICVIHPLTGEVSFRKIACKCRQQIVEFFSALPRPHVVAIESVGFYRWLWDLLYPICDRLVLADATACRALAGRRIKTDRQDAANVAELLAAGRLPVAYAPPEPVYELRDWTRHRNYLSRCHARCLHRVKSLMNLNNRPGPARLQADSLIRYIKAQESVLRQRHVSILWMAVDQLALVERQMAEAERQIGRLLGGAEFERLYELLRTLPGVGMIVAATVLAEVGDFARFTCRKSIVRYAGMNPRTFESADSQRGGRISKAGPPDLRWVLQQASWTAIRHDPAIRQRWAKVARRAGRKGAAVAVARMLLLWMSKIVKSGQPWRPSAAQQAAA